MKKLFLILMLLLTGVSNADVEYIYEGDSARVIGIKYPESPKVDYERKGVMGQYNCCVEAFIPSECDERKCQETYPDRMAKQVVYDVQFNACVYALNNAKKRGEIKIGDKTQTDYCKCVAGQMVDRVDIEQVAQATIKKDSQKIMAVAEKHTEPSFRFCGKKMNVEIIKNQPKK